MNVVKATNTVTVHSQELDVHQVSFKTAGDGAEPIKAKTLSYDLDETTLTIGFGQELPLGEGTLCFEFVGQLNNQMAGFYRSSYTAGLSEKKKKVV